LTLDNTCCGREEEKSRNGAESTQFHVAMPPPANEIDQGDFEIVPIPFNFGVHLKLLDLAGAVDVVGDGVAPGVRVCRDEIPSERTRQPANHKTMARGRCLRSNGEMREGRVLVSNDRCDVNVEPETKIK
jgi:hypothetical protein